MQSGTYKEMSKTRKAAATASLAALLSAGIGRRIANLRDGQPETTATSALVLGSGGLLGVAWHAATLTRLEREGVWHPDENDLRVGTSAGSLVAVLMGAGVSLDSIVKLFSGGTVEFKGKTFTAPALPDPVAEATALDPWFALRALRHGLLPHIGSVVSSLLPEGATSNEDIHEFVQSISSGTWPQVTTWVTASDAVTGKRKVFDGSCGTTPGQAVAASCAVPGLYRPVVISESNYIDGGAISSMHLDLALRSGASTIRVLSPIAGFSSLSRKDSGLRTATKLVRNTEQLALIAAQARALATGTSFHVHTPRPAEARLLTAGALMDVSRLDALIEATLTP